MAKLALINREQKRAALRGSSEAAVFAAQLGTQPSA